MYEVLASNAGRVLSRAELARRAGLADLSARRCDSLIVGIRRAIGHDRVVTVRRRGWMLSPEPVEPAPRPTTTCAGTSMTPRPATLGRGVVAPGT